VNNYKPFFTKEFKDRLQKYQNFKKQIANKVRLLSRDPYRSAKSEQLVGNLKGLRSARVTRSMRIIYAICEECRRLENEELVGCSSQLCEQMDNKVIIFLTFDVHEKVYTRKPKPD